jgi:predicted RNase H-like HicB family nuclease
MATRPEYVAAAMRKARFEQMEDGQWFASLPGFSGVWASASTVDKARKELAEVLDGWISVHTRLGKNSLPDVDGISLHEVPKRMQHE